MATQAVTQFRADAARSLKHLVKSTKVADSRVLLTRSLPNNAGALHLAAVRQLTADCPGNGGLRLWHYSSSEAAKDEAHRLGAGMAVKHDTFNTGFAGAKLVCSSSTPIASWSESEKKMLLDEVSALLKEQGGAMYTGCDMNTTVDDMAYLSSCTPYVLAAIGNPQCCPNTATAYGVFGAVEATLGGTVAGKDVLVHGCGGVGGTVARLLVEHGAASVHTIDAVASRASVDGCVNVTTSHADSWWTQPYDAIVPCSSSGLFTERIASELKCTALVGATNLPFPSAAEQAIAEEERGVTFVPEGVSSAGAVIVDSIEHYQPRRFAEVAPPEMYEFTRRAVRDKVEQLLSTATSLRVSPSLALPLMAPPRTSTPIGMQFQAHGALLDELGAGDGVPSEALKMKPSLQVGATGPSAHMLGQQQSGLRSQSASALHTRAGPRRGLAASAARPSDVVIVGSGIMGLNIAYQLRRRDPNLNITVLEQAPAVGYGSSGYSTGFQRAYYSFDETMQFALDGMSAYKAWKDYLRDPQAEAYFTETGALWMLGYDAAQNEAMQQRLTKFGVGSDLIDEAELAKRFPLINPEPFPTFDEEGNELPQDHGAFSAVHEHGCGHLDSSTCLTDLLRACQRDGINVRFNAGVEGFETSADGSTCVGVRLADGTSLTAGAVVNASGPWFNKLNETAGVQLSTTALATRIQVGHKYVPDEFCSLPFVADGWGPSGIYFMPRAANNQLVFGSVAHRFESEIVDPDQCNPALDPDVKQDYLNCLFHRLPSLKTDGEIIGFSSMYTVNQDDVHPMIGETKVRGLWACNGFSGHGFKLAPAVGSLVAQQITGLVTNEWETHIDQDFMGPYREPLKLRVKTHFA